MTTGKNPKEYINAFERFDKDYDGYISIDDLAELMKKIGKPINEGELQDVKGEINPNDNSMFDLKEYMSIMEKRNREKDKDQDLFTLFQIIDKDENNLIGATELLNYMDALGHKVSMEETEEMIKEFDENGDGFCNFKEFVRMIKYENDEDEDNENNDDK